MLDSRELSEAVLLPVDCVFRSCWGKTVIWAFLVAQMVKNLSLMQETWVQSLGREDSPGGGHGNPLQYSCLENPMDRGAWQAAVHGVTQSRTGLDAYFPDWPRTSFAGSLHSLNIFSPKAGMGRCRPPRLLTHSRQLAGAQVGGGERPFWGQSPATAAAWPFGPVPGLGGC